jgi:peptide-methionine (R)-S-oxide reductase
MRQKATERPFTCEFKESKGVPGTYNCAACGLELFKNVSKFDSGTGWPSFYEPINLDKMTFAKDDSLGIERTEVLCARCDSHLGHVFDDGPPPTGKRFCINGIALNFIPSK